MKKYYTRACNFAYGKSSIRLVREKKNLPLNGNKEDLKVEDEDKGSALSSMGLKPKIVH